MSFGQKPFDGSHLSGSHPYRGISTFRADIDVSTCGQISPLKALNYLIGSFDSDIISLDYRVRGFTRDVQGKKLILIIASTLFRTILMQKPRTCIT